MVDAVLVWRRLVGAQIRSQLQYRLSFALDAFGSFWISFIDFLVVLVIFRNVSRLNAWNVHERLQHRMELVRLEQAGSGAN